MSQTGIPFDMPTKAQVVAAQQKQQSQPSSTESSPTSKRILRSNSIVKTTASRGAQAAPKQIRILLCNPNSTASMTRACVDMVLPTLSSNVVLVGCTALEPAPSAIEAYARAGASVLRTDRDGDIMLIPEPTDAPAETDPAGDRPRIRVLRSRG